MRFFKKKEKVPELPSAPALPKLPGKEDKEDQYELPELPSFPNNSKNNNLNQEIVKSAISDNLSPREDEVDNRGSEEAPEDLEGIERIPSGSQNNKQMNPSPKISSIPLQSPPYKSSIIDNLHSPKPVSKPIYSSQTKHKSLTKSSAINHKKSNETSEAKPIFIRIDNFQIARRNIKQIKAKIEEMESLIGEIKKVKTKEEEEIKLWLGEVENLKTRLSELDSDVFSQI